MKRFIITITLLITLVGSVFAVDKHTKKFEEGVAICQQIANDYNIEVEIKKVSALPNNAAAVCMKKNGKFVIKVDWNYARSMTDNIVIPTLIHEMAHAVTDNCGHNQKWINAIYDLVDYFPNMNRYESNILKKEIVRE